MLQSSVTPRLALFLENPQPINPTLSTRCSASNHIARLIALTYYSSWDLPSRVAMTIIATMLRSYSAGIPLCEADVGLHRRINPFMHTGPSILRIVNASGEIRRRIEISFFPFSGVCPHRFGSTEFVFSVPLLDCDAYHHVHHSLLYRSLARALPRDGVLVLTKNI